MPKFQTLPYVPPHRRDMRPMQIDQRRHRDNDDDYYYGDGYYDYYDFELLPDISKFTLSVIPSHLQLECCLTNCVNSIPLIKCSIAMELNLDFYFLFFSLKLKCEQLFRENATPL